MLFALLAIISASTLSILLKTPIKEWFLDLPDERKQHQRLVPRMGGFGILVAFIIATFGVVLGLIPLPGAGNTLSIISLIAATCFVIIGLFDDSNMVSIWLRKRNKAKEADSSVKWELPVRYKFLIEFGLAIYSVWALDVYGSQINILSWEFTVNPLIVSLLVIWIVGVMNSFNIIDGLDTLCGGVSLLTFGGLAYVASTYGNETVLGLSLGLCAITLGFLYHNVSPASVFMGDAGSLFMGFWAAVLPLALALGNPNEFHFEAMVYFVGLPVLDVFVAMFRRFFIIGGGKPFKSRLRCMVSADANHLHHRFIYFGLSHMKASSLMFAFALVFIMSGLIVSDGKSHVFIHFYLLLSIILVLFAAYTQWNLVGIRNWMTGKYDRVLPTTKVGCIVGDDLLATSLDTLDYSRINFNMVTRDSITALPLDVDLILIDQRLEENQEELESLVRSVDELTSVPILLLVNEEGTRYWFNNRISDFKSVIHLMTRPLYSSQVLIQIVETAKEVKLAAANVKATS